MWPWEHAIFGYVVYSLFCHAYYRDVPGERETALVLAAAVVPDVIDKTLFWQFNAFQSGYALAHSILIAVPLAVVVGALARRFGRTRTGLAFGTGYLLHLVGDVIPIYLSSGEWTIRHLGWPLVIVEGQQYGGLFNGVRHHFLPYLREIIALEPTPSLIVQFCIGLAAVLLWTLDGRPGYCLVVRWNRYLYDRISTAITPY